MLWYTMITSFRFISNSKITTQLSGTKIDALCGTSIKWVMSKKDSRMSPVAAALRLGEL
jgi:hypothetical protein